MNISVNYQKRKNSILFNKFQTNKLIDLEQPQNYIPIYERFFSLNQTNWNTINLNHTWAINDIKSYINHTGDLHNIHIFNCKLKDTSNNEDAKKVFIKMAPLLDPVKYLLGKYNYNNSNLFNLPSFDKSITVHPKMSDPNNSSFIDGFFSFLTSKTLHEHHFIHGLDYYGSFLAIKNNYKINIIDDFDYLIQSDFFNKQQNILFSVEDYSHLMPTNTIKHINPIHISSSLKSLSSIQTIDDDIFDNIFNNTNTSMLVNSNESELIDITHSNVFDVSKQYSSDTIKSNSSCSSRTSHTNDEEVDYSDDDNDFSIKESSSDMNDNESDYSTIQEECLMVTFPKFPVQLICMENCENTFDHLIIHENLTQDEWFSALMQIIMMLITYQKMFSFTHNDLHTNNIMYNTTTQKFIYYIYKKKTYKVPTFGKIYKLIDFGRAIYKFQGKIFCSDSFQIGGDASTQYNTEPYFNDKKSRIDPNYSFDICRLACSIFDYLVEDISNIKYLENNNPIVKLVVEWCSDDKGINLLYKANGEDRYPEFKLYKMIARCSHIHTPENQLTRPEFSKFIVPFNSISKMKGAVENLINIDKIPVLSK
jgi:hypothetical protein